MAGLDPMRISVGGTVPRMMAGLVPIGIRIRSGREKTFAVFVFVLDQRGGWRAG
jgi:hypothetical protein